MLSTTKEEFDKFYKKGEYIGKGHLTEVFTVINKLTNKTYVLKTIRLDKNVQKEKLTEIYG